MRPVRRERSRQAEQISGSSWLTTYGDMVTLLMTFFVLLYALSSFNIRKFELLSFSLQSTFGVTPSSSGVLQGGASPSPVVPREDGQLVQVGYKISSYIAKHGLGDVVSVSEDPRGLLIRFRDQVLFDLGKADLKPESRAVLDAVTDAIRDIPNAIRIEGHTDNLPINTPRFPTNWDLSAARAVAVLQYLAMQRIEPGRLSIAGYGEYRPVASNDTEAGRRLNRRVDVLVLSMEQTMTEPK